MKGIRTMNMKNLSQCLVLLFSLITFCLANAQDHVEPPKEKMLNLDNLTSLSKPVYDLLSSNKLIMIGEMHGTNEPAAFVTGLAELFTRYSDSVQVGFEIPPDQMREFLKLKTEHSIYSSDFFLHGFNDGRSSDAWAKAIAILTKNTRVRIFFYDINTAESKTGNDRDSLMYVKIKEEIKAHPKWKTITLSGNIHNMLLPYKGENKTAAYLYNDPELKLKHKLCSLNHNYQNGTMLNNIGKGLELRQVNMGESPYSKLSNSDNFLYTYKNDPLNTYTGIFFTKNITAATLAKTHGAFTVSRTVTDVPKQVPVDTSVYVKLAAETGGMYKTYCDKERKYTQGTFTIHGMCMDIHTKLPLDNTVCINIQAKKGSIYKVVYKTYCNEKGRYQFILPDSLNGQTLLVNASQDSKRVKKRNTPGPCPTECILSALYQFTGFKKIIVQTDSSRNYVINFGGLTLTYGTHLPTFYFRKDELEIAQGDFGSSPVDSTLCELKKILACQNDLVVEIAGHCSSMETEKKKLSFKRAEFLKKKLVALGINPKRLITKGYSDIPDKPYSGSDTIPDPVNKTGYEGQTVTFQIIGKDFKE
jgi:outer membrane protein OmpA-like peptidoglycan-associated protein